MINTGDFIDEGCFTSVYECTEHTVALVGRLTQDIYKLKLLSDLGYLIRIECEGDFKYIAEVKRLVNHKEFDADLMKALDSWENRYWNGYRNDREDVLCELIDVPGCDLVIEWYLETFDEMPEHLDMQAPNFLLDGDLLIPFDIFPCDLLMSMAQAIDIAQTLNGFEGQLC